MRYDPTDYRQRRYAEIREETSLSFTTEDYRNDPGRAIQERDRRVDAEMKARDLGSELGSTQEKLASLHVENAILQERLRHLRRLEDGVFLLTILGGILASIGASYIAGEKNAGVGVVMIVFAVVLYVAAWVLRPADCE